MRGEVMGEPPGASLFAAARRGGLGHQRREHVRGRLPAEVFDHLERLVGEVDGVTAVDEDVVGDG